MSENFDLLLPDGVFGEGEERDFRRAESLLFEDLDARWGDDGDDDKDDVVVNDASDDKDDVDDNGDDDERERL